MEKIKGFLRSLRPWQIVAIGISSVLLIISAVFASLYLRQSAKLTLGSDAGLSLTADRQDSLGAFSDTTFTLKSDTDLTVDGVRNGLVFFPETDFDVEAVNPRQFSIKPKTPLKDNSLYKIKILSDQKNFSWAFQTKNDFRIVQSFPRDKATYVPLNSGIEVTFSHDNFENIERYVEISPTIDRKFEQRFRTISIVPSKLAPETLYTVRVKKGVKLNGSNETLKEDFVFKFETQPEQGERSYLNFSRSFYEFSPSETPAFDVMTSATGSDISVKVFKYPSPQGFHSDMVTKLSIPGWASYAAKNQKLLTNGLSKVLEFNSPVTRQSYTSFFLLPQTLSKGLYLIEGNIGGGGGVTAQALVQITDISAYITVSGTKTLAWVNDVKTGNAISGASVGFQDKVEKTGADGTVSFDTPRTSVNEDEFITVSVGEESLRLPVQNDNYYYSSDYLPSRRVVDKYWSYFYTDRPVYLPQDTVKFWGLLRDRDNLNARQKFTLEVTRSDYTSWNFTPIVLFTKELETSDMGTFIGEIPVNNLNPGWYGITLKSGTNVITSSSFSVETYVKPAYKLTLTPSKKAMIVGETVSFTGQATFFEGSPVPGMELKYNTQDENGKLTTDHLGRFGFSYTPKAGSVTSYYSPEYRYFSILPVLPEEGMISAGNSISIFNSSYVFNSYKSSVKNNKGRVDVDLRLVEVDKFTGGTSLDVFSPAPGVQLTGELMENQWNRREVGTYYDFINKVTATRYEYDRVQNKISDVAITTDANGKAVFEFGTSPNRTYNLIIRATDSQGRTATQDMFIYSYGNEYFSRNNYVYLKTDKESTNPNLYAINEQVNLTVMKGEAPIPTSSSDRYLYLFAQRGLRSYQVSGENNLSFKYPDYFVPNVIVSAVRFTGKTYEVSESLNLQFDSSIKKLILDVVPDKQSYLPGNDAKLLVSAKDQNGSPVQAEVLVNLIDEAYETMYSTPVDPLARIYTALGSDIIGSYYSHRYPLDISGAEGGGCFLPGTQVLMSNGTTKNIEDIKIGDYIKTLENSNSQKLVKGKVTKLFKHEVAGYLLINNHLRVTSEHNLYINGRWMTAAEVKVGDSYMDTHGQYQPITSIESFSGLYTVYNFTVDQIGTYFAEGFYVHNDKGRELFVDNAYFGIVRTGLDGRAAVDFKLPDNLTSWRITSQAVTGDIKVGMDTSSLVVKQPFFVDVVMNTEYLSEDRPQISVRAYGDGLSNNDQVSIRVQSDTLSLDKTVNIKAFESSKIDLGVLKEGIHQITFTGTAANLSDKLTRPVNITKSRLKSIKTSNAALGAETKPEGSADSVTTLVFTELGLGRFYPPLLDLAYTYGDRLDQKIARSLSQELIKKYFDTTITPETVNFTPFQISEGGYSLFPYSSDDIELSAYVAALATDKIDKVGLANYFYKQISKVQDSVVFAQALFGLASLDEPVLVLINNFGQTKDLPPLARIYHALALAKIGDTENARVLYRRIMDSYGADQDQFKYLKVGNKDENLQATTLAAALASLVGDGEANGLLAYSISNAGKDILLVSPKLLAIRSMAESEKPQNVSFAYTLNGKKTTQKLEKGSSFRLDVTPSDLQSITFSDITGSVGVVSHYLVPLDPKSASVTQDVQVGRTYQVRGQNTTTFAPSDLIKVSLPVKFSELTQDGCYQVSDLLPSGLRPITTVYQYGIGDTNIWYPYEINGQRVSFCIGKNSTNSIIQYYARVVSLGEYKAENAIIQSLISPSILNLSSSGVVSIK